MIATGNHFIFDSLRGAPPSRAALIRAAFKWVRLPLFHKKKPPFGWLFLMEQATGVEPHHNRCGSKVFVFVAEFVAEAIPEF